MEFFRMEMLEMGTEMAILTYQDFRRFTEVRLVVVRDIGIKFELDTGANQRSGVFS